LLGDMYYKYDTFNIELVHAYFPEREAGSAIIGSYDYPRNCVYQIRISGLNWENSSFNIVSGCNTKYGTLGLYRHQETTSAVEQTYNQYEKASLRFKKSSRYVNLTIDLGQVVRNTINSAGIGAAIVTFPHGIFKCHIYPVK